jgi:hypothetical protein
MYQNRIALLVRSEKVGFCLKKSKRRAVNGRYSTSEKSECFILTSKLHTFITESEKFKFFAIKLGSSSCQSMKTISAWEKLSLFFAH